MSFKEYADFRESQKNDSLSAWWRNEYVNETKMHAVARQQIFDYLWHIFNNKKTYRSPSFLLIKLSLSRMQRQWIIATSHLINEIGY